MDETDDARVRSLFTPNVRFVEVVEDGLTGGNVIPSSFTPNVEGWQATDEDFATVRSNIVNSGIVGRFVAKDWSGAMGWADLLPEESGTKHDYKAVADKFEAIRQKYEDGPNTVAIIEVDKTGGARSERNRDRDEWGK